MRSHVILSMIKVSAAVAEIPAAFSRSSCTSKGLHLVWYYVFLFLHIT